MSRSVFNLDVLQIHLKSTANFLSVLGLNKIHFLSFCTVLNLTVILTTLQLLV